MIKKIAVLLLLSSQVFGSVALSQLADPQPDSQNPNSVLWIAHVIYYGNDVPGKVQIMDVSFSTAPATANGFLNVMDAAVDNIGNINGFPVTAHFDPSFVKR